MRSKEDAHDYRYFPDPDLQPLIVTKERIERIKSSTYVSFEDKMQRYLEEFKLSKADTDILLSDKVLSEFFDKTLDYIDEPKIV